MIVAAIAVVAAERHEDPTVQKCQGATLILCSRVKPDTPRANACSNIDRKPRERATIRQSQAEDEVSRLAAVIDHRVEVRGATAGIDRWRSGDAERIDIAA